MKDGKTLSAAINPNCNLILKYNVQELDHEPYAEFETEMQLIFMSGASSNNMSNATILNFNKLECEKIFKVVQEYLNLAKNRIIIKRELAQKKPIQTHLHQQKLVD